MILFLGLLQGVASCSMYSCKPSNMIFSEGTCIYPSGTSYFLSACSNSEVCPVESVKNSTCIAPTPTPQQPSWPGEYCISTQDCEYGNCIDKVCIGKHWLESCNSTSECHVGLFCLNSTCWPQREEFQACQQDTDCKNNMGCYIRRIGRDGYCLTYYSLSQPQWVYNCQGQYSSFCESGNCGGSGVKGICIDGIKPKYLQPKCSVNSDCIGESFGWEFYSTCQCGYNSKGTKYCQPFLGDYIGKQYLQQLKDWYNSDTVNGCHTERRIAPQCMINWANYKSYLNSMYLWRDYPLLQDNDQCVKAIYTQYYWG